LTKVEINNRSEFWHDLAQSAVLPFTFSLFHISLHSRACSTEIVKILIWHSKQARKSFTLVFAECLRAPFWKVVTGNNNELCQRWIITKMTPIFLNLKFTVWHSLHVKWLTWRCDTKSEYIERFPQVDVFFPEPDPHIINKRHKGGQMSSLLFWLFLHWISVTGGHHYMFWPSLFVLAVTIC